jgi:hypothetical protein
MMDIGTAVRILREAAVSQKKTATFSFAGIFRVSVSRKFFLRLMNSNDVDRQDMLAPE